MPPPPWRRHVVTREPEQEIGPNLSKYVCVCWTTCAPNYRLGRSLKFVLQSKTSAVFIARLSARLCRIGIFLNGVWREVSCIPTWNTAESTRGSAQIDATLYDRNSRNPLVTLTLILKVLYFYHIKAAVSYVKWCAEETEYPANDEALMLTISTQQATALNERRKISGAMLVDKVKLMASVRFDGVLALYSWFFPHFERSPTSPPAPTTKQKVNFTFDLATYFLFLVRGLASYQDEGKCQDAGSADRRPTGCQVRRLSVNWRVARMLHK